MSDIFDQINKALSGFKGQRLTADVRDKMRAAINDVFADDLLKWENRYDIECQLDRETSKVNITLKIPVRYFLNDGDTE